MAPMYRVGDILRIIGKHHTGEEKAVSSVRMYATDNGYYFPGVDGLVPPRDVELVRRSKDGNPCGVVCERDEDPRHTCEHCRGVCFCEVNKRVSAEQTEELREAARILRDVAPSLPPLWGSLADPVAEWLEKHADVYEAQGFPRTSGLAPGKHPAWRVASKVLGQEKV